MLKAVRFPDMGLYRVPILFLLPVFAASLLSTTPPAAAAKKRATVILDLSSSMSSPLAGAARNINPVPDADGIPVLQPRRTGKRSSRIAETKRALGKAYRDFSPRLNLGIVAFGSKTPGSCSDIRSIEHIGPIDPKRYKARTDALQPVGVSPISDAVRFAAERADYKNTINSFILITDSTDSCGVNLCKLGGELRNSGANLTVHVIGIGLSKGKQKDLRCLAGHTRGHFFSVSTKQQLTKAVYDAFNGVSIASFLKPEPAPSAETIAQAAKAPGGGVNMTALISGDIPLPRRKPKAPPRKPETAAMAGEQPETAPVKVVSAAKEKVKTATAPVTVKKPAAPPAPKMTAMLPQQPAIAKAPSAQEPAPPPAETPREGRLSAAARIIEGSAPLESGVHWNVFMAEGDTAGRKMAASRKGQPVFNLPDGEYIIEAILGYAKARARARIRAGQLVSRNLIFNAGGIKLASVIPGQVNTYGMKPSYSIRNSKNQIIAKNLVSSRIIHLNSGEYTVTSRIGNANSIVTAKISVQPGKLTEATLSHSAGRIVFKLTRQRGGEAFSGVEWKIRKSDGEIVATSAKATPSLILANGTYKATAKHKGKVYRSSFIVRPGDDKVKEVTTE